MRRKIFITLTVMLCIFTLTSTTFAAGVRWTAKQETAHEIAELARSIGLPEDSVIIQEAKRIWHEDEYSSDDIRILATVIYNEAGNGCSEEHQLLVGRVVMNRVADERFPDTIYDVVVQPRQYLVGYANGDTRYAIPTDRVTEFEDLAQRVLSGEPIECPNNVVWQAEFRQGTGTYKTFRSDFGSTTYFCY